MQDSNENVLDLARFRSNKLDAKPVQENNSFLKFNEGELENHIENIKQSIHRINKLISELKTISDKAHN